MMRAVVLLMLSLLAAQPADARCFLFFCTHRHHHARHHHHQRPRVVHKIVVHETIVKKIIVRERKARAPATMDRTPITPLK